MAQPDSSKPLCERSPFNLENCARNAKLIKDGIPQPKFIKTGTTIAGVVFKDGVVLAADTRATGGTTVVEKNADKIHYIAPNIYCCGAGTAADTRAVTGMIESDLANQRLNLGKQSRVNAAVTKAKRHLFRYQGHVSAALIVGGVDVMGPKVMTISPHGHTDNFPFAAMGSGSLACMSWLEANYKDNMTREEAMDLMHKGISRGILDDMGSGFNVDLMVITKEGSKHYRGYKPPE
eukprot:TRINITY_DN67889_c7_g1_i1.p1 TRINITY_DN67889_c7_g1~~TRINITY_DN67889_c7_g1_i1.p1  ORF type:complete len:235 (-),score=39.33 TRINITY_DN67889_c7_g1_i1:164-868(-)